ncbi:hypothetical protein [Candidatus Similichlamydia laticola]|uniref:Uncharacterized protein n=1 Tax=Candidatus Similichlamydia laticola TaxID=2170265 RepID=A0A369K9V3_9BACT|nr:hypothetical protein [Candidatus Similichlamydia laticola]RDB31371.1 hypothetical protein HAT2_00524 [Candidatus Similichlamydia laticola]
MSYFTIFFPVRFSLPFATRLSPANGWFLSKIDRVAQSAFLRGFSINPTIFDLLLRVSVLLLFGFSPERHFLDFETEKMGNITFWQVIFGKTIVLLLVALSALKLSTLTLGFSVSFLLGCFALGKFASYFLYAIPVNCFTNNVQVHFRPRNFRNLFSSCVDITRHQDDLLCFGVVASSSYIIFLYFYQILSVEASLTLLGFYFFVWDLFLIGYTKPFKKIIYPWPNFAARLAILIRLVLSLFNLQKKTLRLPFALCFVFVSLMEFAAACLRTVSVFFLVKRWRNWLSCRSRSQECQVQLAMYQLTSDNLRIVQRQTLALGLMQVSLFSLTFLCFLTAHLRTIGSFKVLGLFVWLFHCIAMRFFYLHAPELRVFEQVAGNVKRSSGSCFLENEEDLLITLSYVED